MAVTDGTVRCDPNNRKWNVYFDWNDLRSAVELYAGVMSLRLGGFEKQVPMPSFVCH